jgi:hypothetical protein
MQGHRELHEQAQQHEAPPAGVRHLPGAVLEQPAAVTCTRCQRIRSAVKVRVLDPVTGLVVWVVKQAKR